jgi:tripartite-type tricarboxylate transporter receptor subunit TctC
MKNFVVALLMFLALPTMAQSWPDKKTITIINSLPVGTTPDAIGRRLGTELEKRLGVTVVTDNRPGAGGLVALQHFTNLDNQDGRVLFIGDSSNFIHAPLLMRRENLLPKIQPVTGLYLVSPVIVTSAAIGNRLSKEHIVKQPFYGSWGTGSWGHICGVEFADKLNTKAQHLPYKAVGMWFADLSNNAMSFSCTTIGTSTPSVQNGKLTHVAVTSRERDPLLPNVPTIKEAFGVEINTKQQWVALYASNSVPSDTVDAIAAIVQDILKTPEMTTAIREVYGHPFIISRPQFARLYKDEYASTKKMLDKYKITID